MSPRGPGDVRTASGSEQTGQRLAAEAGGVVVVVEPMLPVEPVDPVVAPGAVDPSPVLLQADRASAAVSAQASVESCKRFIFAPEVLKEVLTARGQVASVRTLSR